MLRILCFTLLVVMFYNCKKQPQLDNVVTTDIDNFWVAYDSIRSTQDSVLQLQYLKRLYLEKGTLGLQKLQEVRRYTPQEYLYAINTFPKFWESIRKNTYKSKALSTLIQHSANQLQKLYPSMKPAKIYFSIGAFRTNATVVDNLVLVGCELSMTDKKTITSEFPQRMQHFRTFFDSEPIKGLDFLMSHEFVHTQQSSALGSELLNNVLREGVAEFLGEKASGLTSTTPAIHYGKTNDAAIQEAFIKDMFALNESFWLWSSARNQFNHRDLGYYIGYTIAKKYYEQAKDKSQAIKTMIELDYSDNTIVADFIDASKYFKKPVRTLRKLTYENKPKVIKLEGVENLSTTESAGIKTITAHFSEPMNTRFRGFDYGPLGADHVLRIHKIIGFSADSTAITFQVKLESKKRYQLTLSPNFQDLEGYRMHPYLIDVTTR